MEGTGLAGLYEICFEQSWKMMKEVLESKGVYRKGTGTPRKQQAVRPQAAQGRGKGRGETVKTIQTAPAKPKAADAPDIRKEENMNNDKLTILYERLSHEDGRENESNHATFGATGNR